MIPEQAAVDLSPLHRAELERLAELVDLPPSVLLSRALVLLARDLERANGANGDDAK